MTAITGSVTVYTGPTPPNDDDPKNRTNPGPKGDRLPPPPVMRLNASWTQTVAPGLAKPDLDPGMLASLLGEVNDAITQMGVALGTSNLEANSKSRSDQIKASIAKFDEIQAKAAEAAKHAQADKISGWCQAIFGAIGAVIGVIAAIGATGLTGGAAGVLIGVAVVGAVMAIQDVIAMSVKEAGVEVTNVLGKKEKLDLTLGGMVNAIVTQQISDGTIVVCKRDSSGNLIKPPARDGTLFMDEKQLDDWKMGWSVAAGLAIAIGSIAATGGAMKAINEAGKAASAIGKVANAAEKAAESAGKFSMAAERLATASEIAFEVAGGVSGLAGGINGILTAIITQDSEKMRAEKAYMENMIQELSAKLNLSQEQIQKLVTAFDDMYAQLSAMVAGTSKSQLTLAHINS